MGNLLPQAASLLLSYMARTILCTLPSFLLLLTTVLLFTSLQHCHWNDGLGSFFLFIFCAVWVNQLCGPWCLSCCHDNGLHKFFSIFSPQQLIRGLSFKKINCPFIHRWSRTTPELFNHHNGPRKALPVALSIMTAGAMTAIITPATKLKCFYCPIETFCLNTSQNLLLVIAVMHWQGSGGAFEVSLLGG